MKELMQLKDILTKERPASWEEFPDIGLYKDQVVTYVSRQLISFNDEDSLTSSMINNYIKDKLLPRADGKKYSKEHLASLIEICILKQALPVRDIGFLLHQAGEESDPELFYKKFIEDVDLSLTQVAEQIEIDWNVQDLADIALRMAISSYCYKIVCERLIEIIRSSTTAQKVEDTEKMDEKNTKQQGKIQKSKKN